MSVRRIYVEKKAPYAVKADKLRKEINNFLGIKGIDSVRILTRYDIENIEEDIYQKALETAFVDTVVEDLFEDTLIKSDDDKVFAMEFLPGQYDQREDSAEKTIELLEVVESNKQKKDVTVLCATAYVLSGKISDEEFDKIKSYCINPVDSREVSMNKPKTSERKYQEPGEVEIIEGFIDLDEAGLDKKFIDLGLAMTIKDLKHIQDHYKTEEKRNPSITEIKVLDTYWSDHCRHTTFLTELNDIGFDEGYYQKPIKATYEKYLEDREKLYKDKERDVSLMDIALFAMRKLRDEGKLEDMEVSDEINACSIIVPVDIDGVEEEWLIFFKNETHNHPTEIEPFGGAGTCLGGAIRDPLSGRGYVYQAMRVTGSADPRIAFEDTMEGKLPQRTIGRGAAEGYSSYGNQIGITAGLIDEIYHPNYVAKRMEIGAVMGAAPRRNVIRENSDPGDIIILLGGRTGRDGIGGATGSSKVQTTESSETSGAEVQKGNPPMERKIQRLFRREEVSSLIKKCNDFGAGGVSVAIGELADGLKINVDKVPVKYPGLDGTEIAISESQERMAIVVDPKNVDEFLKYAKEENLEAVVVAEVTQEPRLVVTWKGKDIVNISRKFLDTNGAHQEMSAHVTMPKEEENYFKSVKIEEDIKVKWLDTLKDLNVCSKKGLSAIFDASIGANTVTMPYGGKYQRTPIQTMVSKVPVVKGETNTVTMMSYGFDPYLSTWSPYHGSIYSILSSVAKIVASGGDYKTIRFTFQEYFKRLGNDKKRWGEPLAALLGAYDAQMNLELPSIGGKDSMSGSFHEIDVPPTLVSFAVNIAKVGDVISPELKEVGNILVKLDIGKDEYDLPNYPQLKSLYDKVYRLMKENKVFSAYAVETGGIVSAISKMAFGNGLGVRLSSDINEEELFSPDYGSIVIEISKEDADKLEQLGFTSSESMVIGEVTKEKAFIYKDIEIDMAEAVSTWEEPLEEIYPTKTSRSLQRDRKSFEVDLYKEKNIYIKKDRIAKPRVFMPLLPGTNSEYDLAKAFNKAGADVIPFVFKNGSKVEIAQSIKALEEGINHAEILMMPGGFSSSDEQLGTGKYARTLFSSCPVKDAIQDLLKQREGLVLGIGNGFQSLIKLGLLPYGEITAGKENMAGITTNITGRHISKMIDVKLVSNKSPWFANAELGGIYTQPISHEEGRFVASDEFVHELMAQGQIASLYVDREGNPTMDEEFNPNGSVSAVEAITSPDGRVLGKMAHPERNGKGVAINIVGNQDQLIFKSGVEYFK